MKLIPLNSLLIFFFIFNFDSHTWIIKPENSSNGGGDNNTFHRGGLGNSSEETKIPFNCGVQEVVLDRCLQLYAKISKRDEERRTWE